ncbi:hypothetical protein CEXT_25111 [Caerostris extrusa]|uniref:Uncharacterized protein n=1 Tax=Caerostris extrusa TaxID=172846 RepID=A0AAV4MRJ8_CAEEX|nr:hypothetical protein CEXT_25111 [Caerostris extrusa]
MKFQIILVALLFLITCFKTSDGQGTTQQNPTKCDEQIAENLCSKHKDKIKECAELMPEDPTFCNHNFIGRMTTSRRKTRVSHLPCRTENSSSPLNVPRTWKYPLQKTGWKLSMAFAPRRTQHRLLSIWFLVGMKKRNSTLDQKCKKSVFMEAMKDMDCPCKTEKHVSCGTPGSEKAHAMTG